MKLKYITVILILGINQIRGQTREDFIKALLTDYDSRIPPNFEKDVPCAVNVSLYINSIDSINEQTMDFTLSTFVSQRWQDKRLKFQNLIDAPFLELDAGLIGNVWVPDLYFRNEKRAHFHDVTVPNKMLHIYQDGTVDYKSRLTLTAACPMKLHKYPMDAQTCSLLIQSFAYSSKRLTFKWELQRPVVLNPDCELPQFTVSGFSTSNCTMATQGDTCIQLDMYLKRNIGFYMIQLYIPSILIVMLSWLSFWLHVDASPARVSLGILTVLTITTQRSMATATLPRVSYVKAIDVWMAVCLCFVFTALLEYACVNVLARKSKAKTEQLSKLLKNGVIEEGTMISPNSMKMPDRSQMVDNISRLAFPSTFLLFCMVYALGYGLVH